MAESLSALTFLTTLYGEDTPGYLSLFLLPSKQTLWQQSGGIRALLRMAKPHIATQNVYFGLGLRGGQTEGRGEEADVVAIPALWCDLDIASPVHNAKNLPPSLEAAQSLLAHACPFLASVVIHSGHGLQAYWLFREPWAFEDTSERDEAKALCQRLQQSIQALAKDQGWHVDSTFDLARVFRLPGTYNRKAEPVPVTCLAWNPERRYSPSEFDDVLPPVEQHMHVPPPSAAGHDTPALHALAISPRMKFLLRLGEDPNDPNRYPSRSEAEFAVMTALVAAGYSDRQMVGVMLDPTYVLSEKPRERGERWLLQEIGRARAKYVPSHPELHRNGTTPTPPPATAAAPLVPPETLTELLAADIPPPRQLFEQFMHEGMLLFGGKSKRGKSWLIFDIAISLAVGRSAFRHFHCPAPMPVLYLALEDGRARLQGRARAIQPNLQTANQFHLRYNFPPLAEGGIQALTQEIERYRYGLVVVDVLAKLEKPKAGKGEKNYHDIYEMFAPLQELRRNHPFCLAMLTHLRKQEADDVFDSLLGSVAYQGAQDVLWVLERKPKDDFAFLHIRDKDAEDKTIALRFIDGHWEYIGEGEEYEVSRDQRKIIKILAEERRELSIQEICKAGDYPEAKYAYIRKLLVSMVKDDLIHRARHGKYSSTIRGELEMGETSEDNDAVPF